MIRRLQPLRHALPAVALLLCAAAWAFPPYFHTQSGALTLIVEPLAVPAALVGWLLTTRRRENPIGWLFSLWSIGVAFAAFSGQYVEFALQHGLPAASWVGWVGTALWYSGFLMFVLILLLFPTGTLMSPRWRRFTWFAVALYAVLVASALLYPEVDLSDSYPNLRPPFRTPFESVGNAVFGVALTANLFCILIAISALVVRYRRTTGTERYQIKWFVWPVALMLLLVLVSLFAFGESTPLPLMLPVIPVAAGVAILRYRLYDIDRVISRTVAWLLLTGVVVGVYVGVVATVTAILPASSNVAVAAATLAAAAVFEPARRRLQTAVDRRFNRERYDAAVLVERFAGSLRDAVELEKVEGQLLDVTVTTMRPSTISLWRADAERGRSTAAAARPG